MDGHVSRLDDIACLQSLWKPLNGYDGAGAEVISDDRSLIMGRKSEGYGSGSSQVGRRAGTTAAESVLHGEV